MKELTKEDWVEIYYALEMKAKWTEYHEGDEKWTLNLREIMGTIGPDGENMALSEYSEPEKELIGKKIAAMLYLRKSQEEHGRYRTSWGTKTPVGIFETIRRLGAEIEEGTITTTLIKNE